MQKKQKEIKLSFLPTMISKKRIQNRTSKYFHWHISKHFLNLKATIVIFLLLVTIDLSISLLNPIKTSIKKVDPPQQAKDYHFFLGQQVVWQGHIAYHLCTEPHPSNTLEVKIDKDKHSHIHKLNNVSFHRIPLQM